jgi:3-hydroxyisobutyrate dehydrogenase
VVAFLGAGRMGGPMAANLARAGFGVRAWDRTASRAAALAEVGATVTGSPAEAVKGAGILVTMLADGPATEQAWSGPDGLLLAASPGLMLLAASPGLIWVQMATVGLEWTGRFANTAAQYGISFFDAPVSGSQGPAQAGQLTILASGPHRLREAVDPVFAALGRATAWLGPAGNGTRAKLVLNNWLADLTETTAETLGFARQLGLDPGAIVDLLESTPLGSPYAVQKARSMLAGDFAPAFALKHRAQGRGPGGAGRTGQRRRAHPHRSAAAPLAARRRQRARGRRPGRDLRHSLTARARGSASAGCVGYGRGDRSRIGPHGRAIDQDGRRRLDSQRRGPRGHIRRPVKVRRVGQAGRERRPGQSRVLSDAGELGVAQARPALRWLADEQRVRVLDETSGIGGAARGRGRARGVVRRRSLVKEIHRMVDETDLPVGHQPGQRGISRQLELPAERAKEIDEGVDANRAVPDHDPVALRGRAGRKAARDAQLGHEFLQGDLSRLVLGLVRRELGWVGLGVVGRAADVLPR